MKKHLLIVICAVFLPVFLLAQTGAIEGKVYDRSNGKPIPGANVIVQGTELGAATDNEGYFFIDRVPQGKHAIIISVIGYEKAERTVNVKAGQRSKLRIGMKSTVLKLSEVVVQANIAKDRETPVAFSNISEDHIRNNFTVQDVPHLFANTPGVYVTTDGGSGMGDSKVRIRGFDEQRIQVMINNVPVNDPESKKVYWSNWGSLPAAAQSIQIQRGVGSSLYGSGALGGSINVITKDAPADKSLSLTFTGGQYGIFKGGLDYNTGLINGKFAFITRLNYLQGNGWRDDTFYRGLQYYFSAMYFPNQNNTFKIILHGAPQYHAYAYYGFWPQDNHGVGYAVYGKTWNGHPHINSDELDGTRYEDRATKLFDVIFNRTPIGASFDKQIGGLVVGNGRASFDNNVYHKPQFEIHHSLKLNETSRITSTFFASKGYGYGENLNGYYKIARGDDGNMTWAAIDTGGQYQYRNYSDHFQTGLLSSFETKIGNHDVTLGLETRWWKARHAGEILNVFSDSDGLISYYIGSEKQKFGEGDLYYDYTTTKPQISTFAHALWRFGKLNVMTDVQYSFLSYHIVEDVPSSNNYPDDPEDHGGKIWTGTAVDDEGNPIEYQLWDYTKTFSYISPKFGVNYNLTNALNVFANWSQAVNEPRVKYFFAYGSPNDALNLEKTNDYEIGAGYRSEIAGLLLNSKYNFYYIAFEGKALRITDPTKANTPGYDYKGRRYIPIGASTYTGHEIAITARMPMNLEIGVNVSLASNLWGEPDDSEGAQYLYSNEDVVAGVDYNDLDSSGTWDTGEPALHKDFVKKFGHKVEVGMPQVIYGGTLNYSIGGFAIGAALRHYEDIYVLEDNSAVLVANKDGKIFGEYTDNSSTPESDRVDEWSPTLPAVNVVDLSASYRFAAAGIPVTLSLHINNLFDTEYWQTGNSYGLSPGAARTIILNSSVTF